MDCSSYKARKQTYPPLFGASADGDDYGTEIIDTYVAEWTQLGCEALHRKRGHPGNCWLTLVVVAPRAGLHHLQDCSSDVLDVEPLAQFVYHRLSICMAELLVVEIKKLIGDDMSFRQHDGEPLFKG
uniref:(northern house mosquito) hypothetical protein n=1 Tax=Culex pipiens TaxID=7175 RepID=A0A8D8F948_CULPI